MTNKLKDQSFKYLEAKFYSCMVLMTKLAAYITNKYIVYKINSENKDRKFKVGDEVSTNINAADILIIHIALICIFLTTGTFVGSFTTPFISALTGAISAFYMNAFAIYFVKFVIRLHSNNPAPNYDNN